MSFESELITVPSETLVCVRARARELELAMRFSPTLHTRVWCADFSFPDLALAIFSIRRARGVRELCVTKSPRVNEMKNIFFFSLPLCTLD